MQTAGSQLYSTPSQGRLAFVNCETVSQALPHGDILDKRSYADPKLGLMSSNRTI